MTNYIKVTGFICLGMNMSSFETSVGFAFRKRKGDVLIDMKMRRWILQMLNKKHNIYLLQVVQKTPLGKEYLKKLSLSSGIFSHEINTVLLCISSAYCILIDCGLHICEQNKSYDLTNEGRKHS